MNLKNALQLKPGDKIRYKLNGEEVTVVKVLTEPTKEEPQGNFPLVVTKEKGAISYLSLRYAVK